jgi:ribulose-phosphate 3-epimerase
LNEKDNSNGKDAVKLAPSILAADFAHLGDQVAEAERAGADRIHVDVMDGHFVPNISNGRTDRQVVATGDAPAVGGAPDDFQSGFLSRRVRAGRNRFISGPLGGQQRSLAHRAMHPATPGAVLEDIMAGPRPGAGHDREPWIRASAFPPRLPKIARAREMIDRIKPGCGLEVDGGIDATTAALAVGAGADVLVAGSAIFNDREGVTAAMKRLRAALPR